MLPNSGDGFIFPQKLWFVRNSALNKDTTTNYEECLSEHDGAILFLPLVSSLLLIVNI